MYKLEQGEESLKDVYSSQQQGLCVFLARGVKFRVSASLQQLTHSCSYQCDADPLTGRYNSWKMSSSLHSTGKFSRLTPTPPVWEGIPWWASEWLTSAEVINESFPTCSTTGIPWPPSSGSVTPYYLKSTRSLADTQQKQKRNAELRLF